MDGWVGGYIDGLIDRWVSARKDRSMNVDE